MNLRQYLFLIPFVLPFYLKAQPASQLNAAEIKQGLEGLNVTGSVLYIAAHPDDENTRLLAYLAKEKKVRTGYLSLTRGDGGQNLIGNEQGELLGLIRTQELLAARRTDGAEQFFTRANDFGFSKTPEESFKIWDKAKILADVVWVIRKFQPDVIITRFPEDGRAGHGHHSGSAILAREAFVAAADPKQFPEQLAFVKPWQAKRIVWNTFNFGGLNTTADDQLKIDVGLYNALLGKSYGEIAADSRSNHKSQGFGSAKQRGSSIEYFTAIAGDPAKKDLFEGLDFTLNRYPGTKEIQQLVAAINREYQVSNPGASVPKLLKLRQMVKDKYFKHDLLDQLILACSGIWLEAAALSPAYALNDSIPVKIQAIARAGNDFPYPVLVEEERTGASMALVPNQLVVLDRKVFGSASQITQPYWLEKKHDQGSYNVDDLSLIGLPENPAIVNAVFRVKIGDQVIARKTPVIYKFTDPVRGEIYQPLVIAPPVTANFQENAFLFNGKESKTITVALKSFQDGVSGTLTADLPSGWVMSPEQLDFKFSKKGAQEMLTFKLSPGAHAKPGDIVLNVNVNGKTFHQGLRVLSYDHIPLQTLFPLASAKIDETDLKFAGKKIGYIAGAGDLIPESLKQIGFEVTQLSAQEVLNSNLSGFDAIVTGVRLYNISNQINEMQPKLLKYVENGGVLLLQYNVNSPLKLSNIGPYPFRLANERVTEEDADVDLLAPNHPSLNYPNKISQKDFEGWVQERGLYFAVDADPKYTPILGMHDTGDTERTGSLLVANYGKGKYVYTSLSFFRQLPAGVTGAYRLFINLLSNKK
ncbi:PIG-L family deacetylase [Pedobacter gandavensis]|uniref:LmbE family protein n=1 Tax=Pedobacter gandavensis TaxID=2679963 RepID=A0ABR6F0P6_9SPHI|nr:PIG-L family deacetylase [Pedobacter gandavensis]MBB2150792.1 LmbE family protein [Pedobacter gandavensis]